MTLSKAQAAFYADWLAQAGIYDVPAETPTNFYKIPPKPKQIITQEAPKKAKKAPLTEQRVKQLPNKEILEAVAWAEKLALAANNLDELKQAMDKFEACDLKHTAHNLVFADGNRAAKIMLIGEAPGESEDRAGIPFVGVAGQLLDKMLAAIGLSRKLVYITNILPWRPPANRNPQPDECAMLRPFLNRHINLIAPKVIVLLGGIAAKEILATETGITKLRGVFQKIKIEGKEYKTLPMFHPAYLLRQPAQKRLAWEDLLLLKKEIEEFGDGAQ